jgi:putative spermidine/putrescine transport system permease protein
MATLELSAPVALRRRLSAALYRRPRAKLALLLAAPLGWMGLVYLGALASLLVTAFWRLDPLTSTVQQVWGLQNFRTLVEDPVYRTITLRTLGMAAAVTATDIVLAFPIAYHIARIASPRGRQALLLAVVMPLWSNYLVRVFAWKTILEGGGVADWVFAHLLRLPDVHLAATNWAVWITFCYLWLPFVILPIATALERVPASYLEASADLGAKGWTTFRRVVLPLALPGVAAGSIFSFSLTLGDYITPPLVGKGFFIGNAIYNYVGLASNLPLAAAFAAVPVAIMALYLLAAKRLGAFEAL